MGIERSDRDLVVAYQGGERAAFEEIDRRYRPMAERVCSRILFDKGDVEDAVQDTMLAVYRRLPTFNGRYLLGPYVARIATNRALDLIRYKKRRPQLPLTETLVQTMESQDDPVDVVLMLDDAETVGRVLEQLPPTHARALELRAHEASHEQIAQDLQLTPPKAKALLHRARGSFRQAWLAELSAIIAAIGGALRKSNEVGGSTANSAGAQAASTGSSQLIASVTNIAANAAPMINSVAVAAEPVAQTASKFVATTAAAVITIGSAGAGVILNRHDAATETFLDPRPAVSTPYQEPTPFELAPVEDHSYETQGEATTDPSPSEQTPSESSEPPAHESEPPSDGSPTPSEPEPSQEPSPDPSHEPRPDPTEEPEPEPFSGRFQAQTSSPERCGCSEVTELVSVDKSGSPGERLLETLTLQGGILEARGQVAWSHESVLTFDVEGDAGSGRLSTKVIGETSYRYEVAMTLSERGPGRDGQSILTFSGAFDGVDGPFGQGTLTVVIAVDEVGEPVQMAATFASAPSA